MSNNLYDFLKKLDQLYLPAIGTAYAGLAKIWDLPYPNEIPATIMIICTMLGSWLGLSSANYYKNLQNGIYSDGDGEKYDE